MEAPYNSQLSREQFIVLICRNLNYYKINLKFEINLDDFFKLEIAKLMFKYKSKNIPLRYSNIFRTSSDFHQHNTRSATRGNFYTSRYTSTRSQRSLNNEGV